MIDEPHTPPHNDNDTPPPDNPYYNALRQTDQQIRDQYQALLADPTAFLETPTPNGRHPEPATDRFTRYTAAQLLQLDRTFTWLADGLITHPTYGMLAGEMKTLKSTIATFIAIGIASGTTIFDRFTVQRAQPVLFYSGEGGRIPYTNRLERIATAMHVKLDDIPLHLTFDAAPINSPRFQQSLTDDLDQTRPALAIIDPWYAYHGTSDSRNLHEEGGLLTSLSNPIADAGASLMLGNHFNKTGTGTGLGRITLAGGGEWADSWWLVSHREAADVHNGHFQLLLEIGSRQWGGSQWDLDIDLGHFDPITGEHTSPITWDICPHTAPSGAETLDTQILELLADQPYELTKTEIETAIGGKHDRTRSALTRLESIGQIGVEKVQRENARGSSRPVWVFGHNAPEGAAWGDATPI